MIEVNLESQKYDSSMGLDLYFRELLVLLLSNSLGKVNFEQNLLLLLLYPSSIRIRDLTVLSVLQPTSGHL